MRTSRAERTNPGNGPSAADGMPAHDRVTRIATFPFRSLHAAEGFFGGDASAWGPGERDFAGAGAGAVDDGVS
ncbi:MAG: hypothetical protein U0R19_06725 [Bryobacteraceae bacterium]